MPKLTDAQIIQALRACKNHSAGQVAHDLGCNIRLVARIQQAEGLDGAPAGQRFKPTRAPLLTEPAPHPRQDLEAELQDRRSLRVRRQARMVPDDRRDEIATGREMA